MSDTLMVVIGIFLAVILMFIFPLMSISERNDDMAQSVVQTEVSEFVDKVSVGGRIKVADYEQFASAINAANGAPYDIDIEVQHFDDNLQSKVTAVSGDLIGENVRYSTYTTEIKQQLEDRGQDYVLNKGDNVIVTVRSTSQTVAQMLRSSFYKITGQDSSEIVGSASSMVVNGGRK